MADTWSRGGHEDQHRRNHGDSGHYAHGDHARHLSLIDTDVPGVQSTFGSFEPSITSDERFLTFVIYGDLQIHLKDLRSGEFLPVSSDAQGNPGDSRSGPISHAFEDACGHVRIAFDSMASNLVPDDTNGFSDVFIKDIATGAVTLVSTDSQGHQGNGESSGASVSGDGHHVAFASSATNFLPEGVGTPKPFPTPDVYLKDLDTGQLTLVSANAQGHQGTGPGSGYYGASLEASVSWDGSKVAFASYATDLVEGDTNAKRDVYVKDVRTGEVTLVSSDSEGHQSDGESGNAAISADGQHVVFYSSATNLAPGATSGDYGVYLKDLRTGHLSLISADAEGHAANGFSGNPAISPNGRYVAFNSSGTNLDPDATSGNSNVYVRDMLTGKLTLVSVNADRPEGPDDHFSSVGPRVLDNGDVFFTSNSSNLVPNDTNGLVDVFLSSGGHGHDPWA